MKFLCKLWWNERDLIKDIWIDYILEIWGIVLKIKLFVIEGEIDRIEDCVFFDSIFILVIIYRFYNFFIFLYCIIKIY